jgi:hypothetical protein
MTNLGNHWNRTRTSTTLLDQTWAGDALELTDKSRKAVPAEVVRVDGQGHGTEKKVARAELSAPAAATFRRRSAERWHDAPSSQVLSGTGVEGKARFLAKGGNAWHFMKLPGKTCVLPPYQETRPAPYAPRSRTPPVFCPPALGVAAPGLPRYTADALVVQSSRRGPGKRSGKWSPTAARRGTSAGAVHTAKSRVLGRLRALLADLLGEAPDHPAGVASPD